MPRKQILRKLQGKFPPGFSILKGKLYAASHGFIIRGVIVDGTPYKQTWHVLDFTYPLFQANYFVHLSYSTRLLLPGDEGDTMFSGTDDEIADAAMQAIEDAGLISKVADGDTPSWFLHHHGAKFVESAHPGTTFDMACCAALCGDGALARHYFEASRRRADEILVRHGHGRFEDAYRADLAAAERALAEGDAAFRSYIGQVATDAAAAYGFSPPSLCTAPVRGDQT